MLMYTERLLWSSGLVVGAHTQSLVSCRAAFNRKEGLHLIFNCTVKGLCWNLLISSHRKRYLLLEKKRLKMICFKEGVSCRLFSVVSTLLSDNQSCVKLCERPCLNQIRGLSTLLWSTSAAQNHCDHHVYSRKRMCVVALCVCISVNCI